MTSQLKHFPLKAYLAVVSVIFAAAYAPIAIRLTQLEGVPSLTIVAFRLLLTSLILAPFIYRNFRHELVALTRADWGWISAGGVMHAVSLSLLFFSLEYSSILVNAVLRRTSPFWVIWLEILLLGAVFHRRIWWGVLLTVFGGAIVAYGGIGAVEVGDRPVLGITLALINALASAIYLLIGRKVRERLSFWTYSWLVFLIAGLLTSTTVWMIGAQISGFSAVAIYWMLVVTVVAQFFGHLPINMALRYFHATHMSIFMQVAVVVSAVLALFTLGEVPTLLQIGGSCVLLLGVTLVSWRS